MNTAQVPVYQVLIVGNGPSGISLSNMLSGNMPYFSGKSPMRPRITEGVSLFDKCQQNLDLSIIEQDLPYLSEGLTGRSTNPIALVYDHLNQPNADAGSFEESTLVWRHHPEKRISHLVVGRGKSGGSWQQMQGAQLTVSLNNWLDLPGWSFQQWLKVHRLQLERKCTTCPLVKNDVYSEGNSYDRASTSHVSEYYENYVRHMSLEKNFENNVTVTSVKRNDKGLWEVCGVKKFKNECGFFSRTVKRQFKVHAENVVLATGLPKPKRLAIDGECLPFVHHHLKKVVEISNSTRGDGNTMNPVVVVGGGLTAADAVLELFSKEIPVLHVFRRNLNDEELILNKLPTQVYHDYAKVKDMMSKPVYNSDGVCLYQAYPKCQLVSVSKHKDCRIKMTDGKCMVVRGSAVFILIGSRPDFSFLKDLPPLGVDQNAEVDCRLNPVDVDPFTYECRNVNNLFAMGPLVGDNFVRFGIGGAVGITSRLKKHYSSNSFNIH